MRQLNSERARLDLDVEVWPLLSWTVRYTFAAIAQLYQAAEGAEEYNALRVLAAAFVKEAQPSWDFADHHGPIPPTADGFLRLPPSIQWPMVNGWLDTFDAALEARRDPLPFSVVESDAPTAVDAVLPAGVLKSEVKRRLRRAKAA